MDEGRVTPDLAQCRDHSGDVGVLGVPIVPTPHERVGRSYRGSGGAGQRGDREAGLLERHGE
jgi:hypothetical protein